jgi:hypothetical protein
MALVMGITIPAGLEIIYNKTLRMYDISVLCNVGKNPRFFPRSVKYNLSEISWLFSVAYSWSLLSDDDRNNWKLAAEVIGQHGYNLFVEDKCHRIRNGIAGNAVPSIYHQYLVGHLNIDSPATGALVAQYNSHRIYFPASFEICAKSNLVSAGADPYAKLKLTWMRYYSGQNIENVETIDIPLVAGWANYTKNVTTQAGTKGRWQIEIDLNDVTGDLWFDNVFVTYSGEIKLNDPYCYDVVNWWKNVNPGSGITFNTIYPTGGAL